MQSKSEIRKSAISLSIFVFCMSPALADSYTDGAAQYSAGNYAGAKVHLLKAVGSKPKSWQAHYQLANTFVALKDSASAKAAYSKCLSCNPPADISENCKRAVAYIASNPKLVAPVASAAPISPRAFSSGKVNPSAADVGSSPSAEVEARRSQVMVETEAEIVKMKEREKHRLEELHNNANETWIHSDGAIKQGLSPEEEKAFNREVEEKAAAMREQGKRRAASFR